MTSTIQCRELEKSQTRSLVNSPSTEKDEPTTKQLVCKDEMHGRRREWLISLDRPWLGPDRSYSLKLKGWAATPHKKDGTAQQMTGPLEPANFKAIRGHQSLSWTRKRDYLFILVRSQRCRHLNFELVWTTLALPPPLKCIAQCAIDGISESGNYGYVLNLLISPPWPKLSSPYSCHNNKDWHSDHHLSPSQH